MNLRPALRRLAAAVALAAVWLGAAALPAAGQYNPDYEPVLIPPHSIVLRDGSPAPSPPSSGLLPATGYNLAIVPLALGLVIAGLVLLRARKARTRAARS